MQMLYNSDSYVVVRFELEPQPAAGESNVPGTGGYEIVDKFARKEIFIVGMLAERFQQGVQAIADNDPSEERFDEFIAGFTTLAQQPVTLH
jgi:hypothetical protein